MACTLELIADWFMYKTLHHLHIQQKVLSVNESTHAHIFVWASRDIYIRLTDVLLCVCIISSGLLLLRLPWFYYMYFRSLAHFLFNRDGLPHKQTMLEQHGPEILIVSGVICQTIPVSIILFLALILIRCNFYLNFNHVTFVWCMGMSLVAVTWRLLELVLGVIHKSHDFRGGILCCSRVLICAFLFLSASMTSLNLVVLIGHTTYIMDNLQLNVMTEKNQIDSFISNHRIAIVNRDNNGVAHLYNLTDLKSVVESHNRHFFTPSIPCHYKNLTMNWNTVSDCQFICKLVFDDFNQSILYSCMYHIDGMQCFKNIPMSEPFGSTRSSKKTASGNSTGRMMGTTMENESTEIYNRELEKLGEQTSISDGSISHFQVHSTTFIPDKHANSDIEFDVYLKLVLKSHEKQCCTNCMYSLRNNPEMKFDVKCDA